MNAGEISNIPSKPHSGFVGILVKHRELLEPGNRLQGNALIHQLALARALAEILDGFFQNATASINFDTSEVEHVIKPLAEKVAECIGKIETLGAELNQVKENRERLAKQMVDDISEYDARYTAMIERIGELESRMSSIVSPQHELFDMFSDDKPKQIVNSNGDIIGETVPRSEFAQGGIVLNPVHIVESDAKETIVPVDNAKVSFPPLVPSGRVGGRKRIE